MLKLRNLLLFGENFFSTPLLVRSGELLSVEKSPFSADVLRRQRRNAAPLPRFLSEAKGTELQQNETDQKTQKNF